MNKTGNRKAAGRDSLLLIVSKEPELQRITSQLSPEFNLLTTASYSEGALSHLHDNLIDCVVIGLSNKNAEQVRVLLYNSKLKYPAVPIVIVADHVDPETIRILGSYGADKIILQNCLRILPQTINDVIPNSFSRVKLSDFDLPVELSSLLARRALSLIEEHYIELLSVQEIADHIGVSDSLLVNEFRKNNLISPKKLLMYFKVKHAVNLMDHCDLSIAKIACLSGFTNGKRFIECFRRVYPGYSPFQFRTLFIKK